jgi:hypothetical protein
MIILMRAALVDSDSIVRLSSMHGSQHVNQHSAWFALR